jgi:hypothetical protein
MMIRSSPSNNFFALQWWRSKDQTTREELAKKHKPDWPFRAVEMSTNTIVRIYQLEEGR